jgi:hypothetical protein
VAGFILNEETMNRAVRAVCGTARIPVFAGVRTDAPDARTQIGRRLFTLNVAAVVNRYPVGSADAAMDGPSFSYAYSGPPEHPTHFDMVDGIAALHFLQGQCEGSGLDAVALFVELKGAIDIIACGIVPDGDVEDLPEYKAASWKGFPSLLRGDGSERKRLH